MQNNRIAIIGLGYVGLPLALEFAKLYPVVGFDINPERIMELGQRKDHTKELSEKELDAIMVSEPGHDKGLYCTGEIDELRDCNIFIVTVPTPVDSHKRPDMRPLQLASETVGSVLKKGDLVVYESTVYPGATEEVCIPVLSQVSGLKFNEDFYCGYSPERINPGDKEHTVQNIRKITSGSTPEIADKVDALYASIVKAGTHKASSIRVAEAAKVIENAQRDINIAFVNELSKIFNRMEIDTHEVLQAAATKWNFLPFKPGLVGGHCVGVDPYYLAQKAQEVGYHPEMILAGRRLNDGMGSYIAHEVVKLMIKKNVAIKNSEILILGVTFKENCPDIRNTRVIDIINELKTYNTNITVYDPWASAEEVKQEYEVETLRRLSDNGKYNAIILAVAHKEFLEEDWLQWLKPDGVIYDVKGVLPKQLVDSRL